MLLQNYKKYFTTRHLPWLVRFLNWALLTGKEGVVNKRENCTRSGRQLGSSSSSSICVFEVWALQSFYWAMFSPDINFSSLNNNENIAAGINWAGCGPSSPGQISNPDIKFFSSWKWLAQLYFFFGNTQARSSCYSPPCWVANLS